MNDKQDWPMVFHWVGRNVEEMSREELLETVKTLGKLYNDGLQRTLEVHKMYKMFNDVRRERGYQ